MVVLNLATEMNGPFFAVGGLIAPADLSVQHGINGLAGDTHS